MSNDNSIGIIDNRRYSHLDEVLKSGLDSEGVDRIRIAVGYLYMSGLKRLRPVLDEFLDNGGTLQVLMGNPDQQGLDELIEAHQNLRLTGTKFKQSQNVKWSERPEIRAETANNYSNQLLYENPTAENQAFFTKLIDWLEQGRIQPKLYLQERFHAKAYLFEKDEGDIFTPKDVGVVGSSNLSLSGLHSNTELNAPVYNEKVTQLKDWFDDLWDDAVEFDADLLDAFEDSWVSNNPGHVSTDDEPPALPRESLPDDTTETLREVSAGTGLPAPYLVYAKILYELYKETLETAEDYLQSFDVYEDLYEFQQWAVNRGIRIANKYDGVLVSDVVGMGKTFVGLGLLEHFHARNRLRGNKGKMLIISPKHLQPMWERMVNQRYNFNAEVISLGMVSKEDYHETLLEEHDDASVCLVDEAHHFRNDDTHRYNNLQAFLPTVNQTILLTATPYTKSAWDVYNQIKLFHIEDLTQIPITPPNLYDFTEMADNDETDLSNLLSHVMVRRTRQDIIDQYGEEDEDGRLYLQMGGERRYLPDRHLQTVDYNLHETYSTADGVNDSLYDAIVETLEDLTFARYSLGQEEYLKTGYANQDPYQNLSSMGRSIRGLMKSNLLKRLESSVHAFYTSLTRMLRSYRMFRDLLDEGTVAVGSDVSELINSGEQIDYILEEIDEMVEDGEYAAYQTEAFHLDDLKRDLETDIQLLSDLQATLEPFHQDIQDDYAMDDKVEQLRGLLGNLRVGTHDILQRGDRAEKLIVFTQFTDTVKYLEAAFEQFQERELLSGDVRFASATSDTSNVEKIIQHFAPEANDARDKIEPSDEIDVLFATDVAGEGVNLQDANLVINYDLHWNPLKLIQRIGRVDRLGSGHDHIYALNFLPETELEEELGIVDRVESRVQEISNVLGEDGEILSPEDNVNRSYMEDIYAEEDIEKVEDDVNEIIGSDDLIGPASSLQDLKQKYPDLLSWLEDRDGIRSAMEWDREYDGVVIVYRQGDYTTPYLVTFPSEGGQDLASQEKDTIVETISCPVDEPVVSVDAETFDSRYERAVQVARTEFGDDMGKRRQFQREARQGASIDRDYVVDELGEVASSVENTDQQRTLAQFQDIVETVSADQILDEFRDLRNEEITGEELVGAVREIISRYNLQEKYEERQEWAEEQEEPPHVVAGMYLKGEE
ncbi:helicase-related protein [Natronomonas gomsonensis]|uniref:helicase-related protein n=1 Tax=Natronomonas gomsonensis TaxID=1046043 RepID=UPI0015C00353|nr:helicase-related protein [Natronomonas gomsonensis]